MKKKIKKYKILLLFGFPLCCFIGVTETGCNPHRAGSTVKPMGGSGKSRYHSTPASAKARKKRKY
jgi:hypothetical protein